MSKYISLLRGINVSGQKKILMKDLKALYGALGLKNIITYIQSGNVIFECADNDEQNIRQKIETAIEAKYKFSVYVDVLTFDVFERAYKNHPFNNLDINTDGNKAFIAFLSDEATQEKVALLSNYQDPDDVVIAKGKCLYFHLPNGAGRSKLNNNVIERKLGLTATARNLKTVTKLCTLAKEL